MSSRIPALPPARQRVFDALLTMGRATDSELTERLGLPGGSVRPRRLELVREGLVEQVGTVPTAAGGQTALWAVVPPERVSEARDAAARIKVRRRSIDDYPVEARVRLVQTMLNDDEVNAALAHAEGTAFRRARARARDARADQRRAFKDLKAKIAEAERTRSALLHFLKAKRQLYNTVEVMRTISRLLAEDAKRGDEMQPTQIPRELLPEVADYLGEVQDETAAALRRVNEAVALDEGTIDGVVIDPEEILELNDAD